MAKDNGFSARVIFIAPPSIEVLESRMKEDKSLSEEDIKRELQAAQEEIEQATSDINNKLYDTAITNDDLETAYKALEEFIYETPKTNGVHEGEAGEEEAAADEDVAMKDESNAEDAGV